MWVGDVQGREGDRRGGYKVSEDSRAESESGSGRDRQTDRQRKRVGAIGPAGRRTWRPPARSATHDESTGSPGFRGGTFQGGGGWCAPYSDISISIHKITYTTPAHSTAIHSTALDCTLGGGRSLARSFPTNHNQPTNQPASPLTNRIPCPSIATHPTVPPSPSPTPSTATTTTTTPSTPRCCCCCCCCFERYKLLIPNK